MVFPSILTPDTTPEQVQEALTATLMVPVKVRAIPKRKSQADRRSGGGGDAPDMVATWAALGLVRCSQPEEATASAVDTEPQDTLQRFVVTFAAESMGAVRGSFKKLRAMGIIFHDDLSPQQQRNKAAQRDIATQLYNSKIPIRWEFDQMSKLVHGRWQVVPFPAL